jgi:hypothetical protein
VPFLTPHLSSLWLGLVTPFRVRAGRRLVDSLRSPTIVRSDAARQAFGFEPLTVREAVAEALRREDAEIDRSRWGSAWRTSESPPYRMLDRRSIDVPASPSTTFAVVERIGGKNGWYHADWLWRIRGVLDRLVGGPGLRRGRRDPDHVVPGDVLDFWRVTDAEPGRHLRLQAEMKIPGRAWLDFEVEPTAGGSRVHQTAMFDPRGVFGRAYWFALVPLHSLVFGGLLRAIARRAVAMEGAGGPAPMRIAAP